MRSKLGAIAVIILTVLLMGFWLTDLLALENTDEEIVAEGNNEFALNLYAQLKEKEGNIFFSPFSVSTALAMTYAGARENTATQMADVLHFTLNRERLDPSFLKLMQGLRADSEKSGFELSIANALWGQQGYKFYPLFLDITERYYEAGFKEVNFIKNAEEARRTINMWVENKTNDKIKKLIPQGILTELTRLVLTNAIYFKGKWQFQFDVKNTKDSPFTLANGEKATASMMNQTKKFNYADDKGLQIIEMPYVGDELSMVILLPKKVGGLKQLEGLLTRDNLSGWLSILRKREVIVSVPKFKMTSKFELSKNLISLGMIDAFMPKADFSGMTPDPIGLYISVVLHKAFVDVTEEGTEAAAATAVVMTKTLALKPVFRADHPFIFFIRHTRSGSILFIGRVMDPNN